MITKLCRKCGETKSTDEFNKNSKKKDGCQSSCRECQKKIDRKSYKDSESRRKQIRDRSKQVTEYNVKLTRRIKKQCGCKLCGEKESCALDFHHVDMDSKDYNPSYLRSCATETLRKEIRKCVVLCANCHRKVHAGILTL